MTSRLGAGKSLTFFYSASCALRHRTPHNCVDKVLENEHSSYSSNLHFLQRKIKIFIRSLMVEKHAVFIFYVLILSVMKTRLFLSAEVA